MRSLDPRAALSVSSGRRATSRRSHRSLNKLCLGLLRGETAGGFLVVPSRKLYRFLTDRIGNVAELEPYFEFWAATPCTEGVLEIVAIEHDAESLNVPRIGKGTDGRSLL